MATVVPTNSSTPPRSVAVRKIESMPPTIVITATAQHAAIENRAMRVRQPTRPTCSIAAHPATNPSTAAVVCTRSWNVVPAPTRGTGHPAVQLTCDATTKNTLEIAIVPPADAVPISGRRNRGWRPAMAISAAPAATSSSATTKSGAVGMPRAPSSLT
jgi:hypothetical protein